MRVRIEGKTPSTIAFNACKLILRGQEVAVLDAKDESMIQEINGLVNANLIKATQLEETEFIPRSQTEILVVNETPNVADPKARTSLDGEKATVWTGTDQSGKPVIRQGKFVNRADGEVPDSLKTEASIRAMSKLNREEKGFFEDDAPTIFEDDLDLSQQMGRSATIGGEKDSKVAMKNSAVPGNEKPSQPTFVDSGINAPDAKIESLGDEDGELTSDFVEDLTVPAASKFNQSLDKKGSKGKKGKKGGKGAKDAAKQDTSPFIDSDIEI